MTPAKRKETRKKYEEMQKARKNERLGLAKKANYKKEKKIKNFSKSS